jgi:hypothetical protein
VRRPARRGPVLTVCPVIVCPVIEVPIRTLNVCDATSLTLGG